MTLDRGGSAGRIGFLIPVALAEGTKREGCRRKKSMARYRKGNPVYCQVLGGQV